jgi:hypothetical protein
MHYSLLCHYKQISEPSFTIYSQEQERELKNILRGSIDFLRYYGMLCGSECWTMANEYMRLLKRFTAALCEEYATISC